jgi:hypothetical protein
MIDINLDNLYWREPQQTKEFWVVKTITDTEPANYPVDVIDVNGSVIGTANNKQEYMDIWNADTTNTDLKGFLVGESFPFVFLLGGKTLPIVIIETFKILQETGDAILTETGDFLILE